VTINTKESTVTVRLPEECMQLRSRYSRNFHAVSQNESPWSQFTSECQRF
jgi:hypothetical protein